MSTDISESVQKRISAMGDFLMEMPTLNEQLLEYSFSELSPEKKELYDKYKILVSGDCVAQVFFATIYKNNVLVARAESVPDGLNIMIQPDN